MPPAIKTGFWDGRPPTRLRFGSEPTIALGSIYHSHTHGRTVARMRYYKAKFRTTPHRLHLPCIIVAVASINAARLIRLTSYIDSDDRYDFFEFDAIPDDASKHRDDQLRVADISFPAVNAADEGHQAIHEPEPDTGVLGVPAFTNRNNYPKE